MPAWNEGAVIGRTLDVLMQLEYPAGRLRVYLVDDASTDATPEIVASKAVDHPGSIFLLSRLDGGQGKAHTINHGLDAIREEGWHDAVLVIDADVLFTPSSLRRMARHFADPGVGAVTAYIKDFRLLVAINVVTYGLITLTSLAIDPPTVRAAWREAAAFPGLVSLATMAYVVYPPLLERILPSAIGWGPSTAVGDSFLLFSYLWVSASMIAAATLHYLGRAWLRFLEAPLLYLVGHGPLLCAITVAVYWRELRGAEMRWEKTEKIGAVQQRVA